MEKGYIRQVLPFTTNLDDVSEKLFQLKTRGGNEYCGYVIKEALDFLEWDKHLDVYKTIFIAGNEPFTQGSVDFRDAVKLSIQKGIVVNTIFCGGNQEGISTQWKAGADLSGGLYTNIDQQAQMVAIKAPQDDEISALGLKLNQTYIPYGVKGEEGSKLQMAQESNLETKELKAAGAGVERAVFKAKKQYNNASWDLVDAVKSGNLKP